MVIFEDLERWMESGGFRFQRLVIDGIDNEPVLKKNRPEMAAEETCIFHSGIHGGNDYLNRLQERMEQALLQQRPLPVVRFADGEYAFYEGNLDCNGLYRQAESVKHIRKAIPFHVEAMQFLSKAGILAPLVFPGNVLQKTRGLLSFFKGGKEKPSAATFLAFLNRSSIAQTLK